MDMKARIIYYAGKIPWISEILRKILRRYKADSVIKIKAGEAKGLYWKRNNRYVNSYWLGTYELELQLCLARELKEGDLFFDIGANAGFFSLIGAKLVGKKGKVIAFEPLEENIEVLKANILINNLKDIVIIEKKAIFYETGIHEFLINRDNSMGKLAGGLNVAGDITLVKTSTLDEMSKKYGIPDLVKIDVEGDEYNVLLGGKYTINIGKTVFIIELHNDKQHQMVADILISSGYKLFDLKKNQIQKDIFTRHILAKKYD